MESPTVFVFDAEREDEAARDLEARVTGLGIERPFILSSVHGSALAAPLARRGVLERPHRGATQEWAAEAGSRARGGGADAIVAVGGGRCLDVAKLAAARAGVTMVAVPTQLSHDGICSPIAVAPNRDGRIESVGAITPSAVFVSIPTLLGAPRESMVAGIGDLLANPLALRDWALAVEHGLEDANQRAWDLSVRSFEVIEPFLDTGLADASRDPTFLRTLAEALVFSGMAMISAGTSRPASGAEHEISHAIDELHGGRALHGAQVAFGCIVSVALYGEDTVAFRSRLERLGLPQHPRDLGLGEDEVVNLLLEAPNTRPGRFTILEDSGLDEPRARALVRRIWNR